MSLNRLLGHNDPDPEYDQTTEIATAANRLIIAGNKSILMDELMKLSPERSEDSIYVNWLPANGIDEHMIDTIAGLRTVNVLDIVVVNSCAPDQIAGERELRKIYSNIRASMQAITSRGAARMGCRWWMCVELDGTAPGVINMWQNAGRLVFRHAAESRQLVGTLVLLGDSNKGASALRDVLDGEHLTSKRVLDFVSNTSPSSELERNIHSTSFNIPEEKNLLVSEMEMVRGSLSDLSSELREAHEDIATSHTALASTREQLERAGLEVAVQTHELFAVETEIAAHRGQIAIMNDQADAIRREIEYLLAHHSSLTENLNSERSALQALREETSIQLTRNEQMQSSLTRAEIDASQQRAIADEAIRTADAAQARLNETVTAITNTRKILAELMNEIENRKEEITRLDQRRTDKASEAAEFEQSLTSRLLLLEQEVSTTQQLRHDVTLMLEKAQAERSAVRSEMESITGSNADSQLEANRISRDYLAIELSHLQSEKTAATTRTDELNLEFHEMKMFIEDVRLRRAELEQEISKLETHVADLLNKQATTQDAVNSLSKTATMYETQREELRRIQRKIDVRQIELEDLRADIDFEVSEQVNQRIADMLALRPRARNKVMKAALINPRSQSTSAQATE
jgi:chromosome segregation ATPase